MEKKRKTEIPETLKELFTGILAALFLFQVTIVWLVKIGRASCRERV